MRKALIVVIDGCAPAYLTKETAPCIYRLCEEKGFIKTVQGAVPTVTNVNHACILSGLWPEDTHMVGNYFYNPKTGESGYVEEKKFMKAQTILEKYKKAGGSTALLTVKGKICDVYGDGADVKINVQNPDFQLIEKLGLPKPPAVGSLEATDWIINAALACIQKESPDLVYCTTNDFAMHHHGPREEEARAQIRAIDECIQKIHALDPRREIYITADHGMNQKHHLIDFQRVTEEAGFHVVCVPPLKDRYIENHLYQEGGVLYLYLLDSSEAAEYARFAAEQPYVQSILTKEEAAEQYHLPVGGIGDYVLFAAEDCAFGELAGSCLETDEVRTHGSLFERDVPLAAVNPAAPSDEYSYSKDIVTRLL